MAFDPGPGLHLFEVRTGVRTRVAFPASATSPPRMVMRDAHGQWYVNGRYWARTSDPQLVELVLSQLS